MGTGNPAAPNATAGNVQINIFDATGQLVQSIQYNTTGAGFPLDISLLKPGAYTITLFQGKTQQIGRFIKL